MTATRAEKLRGKGKILVAPIKDTPKITTKDILQFLRTKYENPAMQDKWIHFEELKMGLGYEGNDALQRIDFWVMCAWKQEQYKRIAYEIKVSRSDFLKEIRNPQKRRMGMLISNYFYFIAPEGLIKPEEIPIDCGLIEVYWQDNSKEIENAIEHNQKFDAGMLGMWEWKGKLKVPKLRTFLESKMTVEAPTRDTPPPSWKFVGNLARRIFKVEHE